VDELIAFLRTCLDDDERAALAAHANVWTAENAGRHDDEFVIVPDYTQTGVGVAFGAKNAEHIARWDPARVLAEVKAKRRVLELHWPDTSRYVKPQCHECSSCGCCSVDHPCDTVKLLTQPYAGRPGWRDEWQA
jgi:hypothetical protein